MRLGGRKRLPLCCLSFLGTSFLKRLNETFAGEGGGLSFRMPGPFPRVKHSPNMQLCERPSSLSPELPAARRAGMGWGHGTGPSCRPRVRQMPGRPGPRLRRRSGARNWPTVGRDESLKLSLSKSPPSFKSDPIKRLLLKKQPWHLGACLCHCCQYFQRWAEKTSLVEFLSQQAPRLTWTDRGKWQLSHGICFVCK